MGAKHFFILFSSSRANGRTARMQMDVTKTSLVCKDYSIAGKLERAT